MKVPLTRAQFERRLHLLREAIKKERLKFARGLSDTIEGIRRVRFLPNRRIDLLTVDETTRLTANMMAQFEEDGPPTAPAEGDVESTSTDASSDTRNEDQAVLDES